MKLIIDTHIFLWMMYEPQKIKKKYLDILEDMDNTIFLSSLSIAEISIKKSLGKLDVEFDLKYIVSELGISLLDYDSFSALRLASLPFHHKDPFDRMIISQAIQNKYKVMTVDSKFSMYKCSLV